jgi:hypothetical protein
MLGFIDFLSSVIIHTYMTQYFWSVTMQQLNADQF